MCFAANESVDHLFIEFIKVYEIKVYIHHATLRRIHASSKYKIFREDSN
jgi:hypothetical protein